MEPKVSFVVPTRNRIEWIAECVGSLLSQDEKDIEVIVVDDASDDGTTAFLTEWLKDEPRVKLLRNEERKGGGNSRNIGASVASAPIIASCDDDDFYSRIRATRIIKFFEENPSGVMLNTPYIRVNLVSSPIQEFRGEKFDEELFKKTGDVNYFCNPSAAYTKKDFYEVGGYPPESEKFTDDYQFLCKWIKAGKKVGFDGGEFTTFHRVLADSMMVNFRGYSSDWNKTDTKGDTK